MRVKDIMKREVRTIAPDRSLFEASEQMRIRGIRHLVVTEHGEMVGILSNRDLAAITRHELEQVRVRDVMQQHLVTIDPNATIPQAANKMRGNNVGSLPVLEHETLIGIVTTTDLLEHLGRNGHTERMTLRDRGNRKKPAHVV
jgi:CBS domain-containing protein